MELLLERKWLKDKYTIGRLSVDGVFFCNILEDKVIDLKIYSMVEKSILGRMTKIRNEVQENRDDDLTIGKYHGSMASS